MYIYVCMYKYIHTYYMRMNVYVILIVIFEETHGRASNLTYIHIYVNMYVDVYVITLEVFYLCYRQLRTKPHT